MTSIYRPKTIETKEWVGFQCDGCGRQGRNYFVAVAIEVNYQEEMGRRDDYDYCDECILIVGPKLIAAGSRAELLTGVEIQDEAEDD